MGGKRAPAPAPTPPPTKVTTTPGPVGNEAASAAEARKRATLAATAEDKTSAGTDYTGTVLGS